MFSFGLNKKKLLTILVLCLFISPSFAKYSGGTGIETDPYLISTPQDVNELSITSADWVTGKYFLMTNDINLPTTVNFITPIGNSTNYFGGIFDGNGYAIRNLNLNGAQYQGLFGCLNGHGNVKNLGVEDANVICQGYSGILVGYAYSEGYVSNCYSTGKITGTASGQCFFIGGLIGNNWATTKNSYSMADVFAHGNDIHMIGGLVGGYASITLENSHSIGNVSVDGNAVQCIGGLAGYNSVSKTKNCYTSCKISVTGLKVDAVGSFIGWDLASASDMIGYSFWNSDINPELPGLGLITIGTRDQFIGITPSQMRKQGTFTDWDFINTWDIGENQTYPFLRKFNISDLNRDKSVNMFDFAIFAENWLAEM
jgi:hypothetical protein